MAYDFYLDKILLPVPPASMETKINNGNHTVTMINEGEVNILKTAGLTDISFTALLPNVEYPFSRYSGGFRDASYFLGVLEHLKTRVDSDGSRLPFQFIVSRLFPDGKILYMTDMTVSLEDYKFSDDVKEGFDVVVDISLKQYRTFKTTIFVPESLDSDGNQIGSLQTERDVNHPPREDVYTVVSGDCLWAVAKKMLGNGNRYLEIYEKNREQIDQQNQGTGNTKYTIYPGQRFEIP